MKHFNLIWIVAVAMGFSAVGCKTTEQNYRNAYEVAKEKFDNDGGLDSTIFNKFRPQGPGVQLVAGTDTMSMHTLPVGMPEGGGATRENLKKYCVVVAQFKQIFNAKAMRERLVNDGYTDAMIVNTKEPLYYVIAGSVSTPEEAAAVIKRVTEDKSLVIREPFPWVLRPAHLAR